MALSYTGLLFKRIVLMSGYTFGKTRQVSYDRLAAEYHDEYLSKFNFFCKRNDSGKWVCTKCPADDNEYKLWMGVHWLEQNGYIRVSWNEVVKLSRASNGMTHFITLTDKGREIAPKYLTK